jgi:uncharacterized protein YecT (DUF1311 family)
MRKALLLTLLPMLFYALAATAQTQLEMNEQACSQYKLADAELNRIYQQILRAYKTDANFIKKFKNAQRAWLIYRDAQLAAIYPDTSPGAYGSANTMCRCHELRWLTEARTKELKRWVEGTVEGDVCAGSVRHQKLREK